MPKVECEACGEPISVDSRTVPAGGLKCPLCGEVFSVPPWFDADLPMAAGRSGPAPPAPPAVPRRPPPRVSPPASFSNLPIAKKARQPTLAYGETTAPDDLPSARDPATPRRPSFPDFGELAVEVKAPGRTAEPSAPALPDVPDEEPAPPPPPRPPRVEPRPVPDAPRGALPRIFAAEPGTFGDLDLGSQPVSDLGLDLDAPPADRFAPGPDVTAPIPIDRERSPYPRPRPRKKRRIGVWLSIGGLGLALAGGAALARTPYGAFGYYAALDAVRAGDYAAAARDAVTRADAKLAPDTYVAARQAAFDLSAAHAVVPRAKGLTAYAAFVDAAVRVRFGTEGGSHMVAGLPGLEEMVPGTPYLSAALAAQAAADGEWDRARAGIGLATREAPEGPFRVELALLAAEVELAAQAPEAALEAFRRVPTADARAHFGLARAYARLGDTRQALAEAEATLAVSPRHVGARLARARLGLLARQNDAAALADLAAVTDGGDASVRELAEAHALRGWFKLERGEVNEARASFAHALGLVPQEARALSGQGELLFREGRFAEALARFESALAADPGSTDAIVADAKAKAALERLEEARGELVAARTRSPKSVRVRLLLGDVEMRLGHPAAAEQELREAVALVDPSHANAVAPYVALARLLATRGDNAGAHDVLAAARMKLPASAWLERAFGEVAEMQGGDDEAARRYRAALGFDPDDAATRLRLGAVLRKQRRFVEAAEELERVRAVDEDFPGLALEQGLLYAATGDTARASERLHGALTKAPDDPDLQLRIGEAYLAIGRPEDALPPLTKALERRPSSAEAHFDLGRAHVLRGAGEDALRHLRRAIDLDPNRAEFYVYLARAANVVSPPQVAVAREALDKALSLDQLSADAYWLRGVLDRNEGAVADAIRDEQKALSLRPSLYEAHAVLAECLEDKNDVPGAMAEWVKAITADPSRPAWRFRYGRLLFDRRKKGEALKHLAFAVEQGEKLEPRPGWVVQAELLTAEALRQTGMRREAAEHYRRYLEIAPPGAPDRRDARAALAAMGMLGDERRR